MAKKSMKTIVLVSVLFVSPVALSATAQGGCADIEALASQAYDQFRSMRAGVKERERGETIYHSRTTLPGADFCEITIDRGYEAEYKCAWRYAGMDAYYSTVAYVESCVGHDPNLRKSERDGSTGGVSTSFRQINYNRQAPEFRVSMTRRGSVYFRVMIDLD